MTTTVRGLAKRLALAALVTCSAAAHAAEPPRLILQITVDALRHDLLTRYLEGMGEGGFRYLLAEGKHYANAHYEHANTETIVGHASLATGTTPAHHGMVGNVWLDLDSGQATYNIEDSRYQLLTSGADVDDATEIDPTQKAASVEGRSPRALRSTTFADELAAGTGGRAKIFAVSVKDRGAVPLAGQVGRAFWFSKAAGQFVSSDYYYDEYPGWVVAWNGAAKLAPYARANWTLLRERQHYRHAGADDRDWEVALPGFGRTFPHPYGDPAGPYFTTLLTLSPAGDALTVDFARQLIREEDLGQDEITDFLAVSLSSNDYVNHIFGSASLEVEDNLLQLDRSLAALFAQVEKEVGLAHTLIVLAADHGTADVADYRAANGNRNVRVFDPAACMAAVKDELARLYPEAGVNIIRDYLPPYLYLDRELIRSLKEPPQAVLRVLGAQLERCPGVQAAIALPPWEAGLATPELVARRVANNFHPGRSGDIHLVLESGVYINDMEGLVIAAGHGSPWNYDTHVPVIFAGYGLEPELIARRVAPYDIAPTLSAVAGVNAPSAALGNPLPEVLD